MRSLPNADHGTPDTRSATRYLLWLARLQWRNIAYGMTFGVVWMVTGALIPATLGKAIDAGFTHGDMGALAWWAGAFLLLAGVQVTAGILRHRNAVYNFLSASYRTVQAAVAHTNRLGATLPKRLATGEVVAIGAADMSHIGNGIDISARFAGAVVTVIVISVIMLNASLTLGLVVVLGVPVALAVTSLLVRPLHHRQMAYRDQQGALTGQAVDIVAGLRVLRGIGGESVFSQRYRRESQRLRATGVSAARIDSLLEAAEVLVPGLFMALVTWLGARYALRGEITPGELISFYGYAAFMIVPLRTFGEAMDKFTRGHVAAGRVLRLLREQAEITDPADPVRLPERGPLHDPESGLTIQSGLLTAIVSERPEDSIEIAERLSRYQESEVTLGGVALSQATRSHVRERILLADNNARLFTGVLREELNPLGKPGIDDALRAASAQEIVDALPDGLDSFVAERGREFSGGQQQRLRLVRALMTEAPTLILVEPTSAVDAHTEARIAKRLKPFRRGLTTVVTTSSPLVLDHADRVVYVEDGKVLAEGTHRALLADEPRYRRVVTREEDS
ncbi:ABC transporter ATP-binding protein [Allorhizocola rhizosphaerae]|uniref:ABC transporter ATP-binding protein n=1 Tax=Allorhizocola rhizosphaerae TaxID=1872709 RepID=UPI000E3BCB99|nr:ABC transporter ATP-binding protein [Allorhizocola rhizosphaerae]